MALKKNTSALKRERQNLTRRARNKSTISAIKTQVKKTVQSIEAGEGEKTVDTYRKMASLVCKAAGKGIIHKNKAARHQSRLAKKMAKAAAPQA